MGLAEKLDNAKRSETGLPCGVAKILMTVDDVDREALEKVFSTRSTPDTISNRQIHKILLSESFDIAFSSISLHRREQCRCFVGKNNRKISKVKADNV